jgi:hypothetical protein
MTNSVVIYYYLNFSNSAKQELGSCLSSLLAQICRKIPRIPSAVEQAWSSNAYGTSRCPSHELKALLLEAVAVLEHTYIVIDALDECSSDDSESLLELLSDLKNTTCNNLHLLVISRQERDIDEVIRPLLSGMSIQLYGPGLNLDIQSHIKWRLAADSKLRKWSNDVKKEIEERLMEGANGT